MFLMCSVYWAEPRRNKLSLNWTVPRSNNRKSRQLQLIFCFKSNKNPSYRVEVKLVCVCWSKYSTEATRTCSLRTLLLPRSRKANLASKWSVMKSTVLQWFFMFRIILRGHSWCTLKKCFFRAAYCINYTTPPSIPSKEATLTFKLHVCRMNCIATWLLIFTSNSLPSKNNRQPVCLKFLFW